MPGQRRHGASASLSVFTSSPVPITRWKECCRAAARLALALMRNLLAAVADVNWAPANRPARAPGCRVINRRLGERSYAVTRSRDHRVSGSQARRVALEADGR